jgi:hypothetical protein
MACTYEVWTDQLNCLIQRIASFKSLLHSAQVSYSPVMLHDIGAESAVNLNDNKLTQTAPHEFRDNNDVASRRTTVSGKAHRFQVVINDTCMYTSVQYCRAYVIFNAGNSEAWNIAWGEDANQEGQAKREMKLEIFWYQQCQLLYFTSRGPLNPGPDRLPANTHYTNHSTNQILASHA